MSKLIPVIRCGRCTERILILRDNLSFFQQVVEILRVLDSYDKSGEKSVFGNIEVTVKIRCQACGEEKIIKPEDLSALSEVIHAFQCYFESQRPFGSTGGVFC